MGIWYYMIFAVALPKNGNFWNHLYVGCGTIFLIFKIWLCSKIKLIFYVQIYQFCMDSIHINFQESLLCVLYELNDADDTLRFYCNVYLRSIYTAFDFLCLAFYFLECMNLILMKMQLLWFSSISSFCLDIFLMKKIQKPIAERW